MNIGRIPPNGKEVERIITASLAEDIGAGDATANALVPESVQGQLRFVCREDLIACGGAIVPLVFSKVNPDIRVTLHCEDGAAYAAHATLIDVEGPARAILTAERVALNLFQRMCSVATLTARYVAETKGTKAVILDTRKTMPGLRELDKYAVRAGGGSNHRMRLDDGILIKDNHIALAGGVAEALRRAEAANPNHLPVEIECDTLEQVRVALDAGAARIMLDNMTTRQMEEAVQLTANRAKLEASGNVTLDRVAAIARTGVDFISVGRLTHSVPSVDIGLDMRLF